jgi:hypothetical protein
MGKAEIPPELYLGLFVGTVSAVLLIRYTLRYSSTAFRSSSKYRIVADNTND